MNDTFLKACRGEKVPYTPVWLMRQAGRYLPAYQKVWAKNDFLTICRTPELAAEVTIQPVDALGVDAAIFFSDITTTMVPMGIELRYTDEKGPSYPNPLRSKADIDRLVVPEPEEGLAFVYEAQKILVRELANRVPMIGFAGAPFTMAAYMIEGALSTAFTNTRSMIYGEPELFHTLMDKVSRFTAKYLAQQARTGCNALMLFDSFAGMLRPSDFIEFNLAYLKRTIAELKVEGVPVIYFGLGQRGALEEIGECGADVIGVDYGLKLDTAIERLGQGVTVQGNAEPYMLLRPQEQIREHVKEVLAQGKSARTHIFNIGHGVPMNTPVENAKAMVDAVHRLGVTGD
jgi:uroporphyrinogen decarboxylase